MSEEKGSEVAGVSGGMMAGVAVAAAPVAICGYLGYKLFKKIF